MHYFDGNPNNTEFSIYVRKVLVLTNGFSLSAATEVLQPVHLFSAHLFSAVTFIHALFYKGNVKSPAKRFAFIASMYAFVFLCGVPKSFSGTQIFAHLLT